MFWTQRSVISLLAASSIMAVAYANSPLQECESLRLELSTDSTTIRVDEQAIVRVLISNKGDEPVTLVKPGDGSYRGLRTPVIRWVIEAVPGEGDPDVSIQPRCCNSVTQINRLVPGEVFTLRPGETKNLWLWRDIGSSLLTEPFPKPGKYRVRFEYENRPLMEWAGIPFGRHDEEEMLRVRQSTACQLSSNEVIFTVSY